jgi:hypothetical protein
VKPAARGRNAKGATRFAVLALAVEPDTPSGRTGRGFFEPNRDPIGVCMANEPRPTNGRPENGANKLIGRVILQANINKGS